MAGPESSNTLSEIEQSVDRIAALVEKLNDWALARPGAPAKLEEIFADPLSLHLMTECSGEEFAGVVGVLSRVLASLAKAELEIGGIQLQRDHPVFRQWLADVEDAEQGKAAKLPTERRVSN